MTAGREAEGAVTAAKLRDLSVGELLALSRGILAELRERGVIRSGNAPAGDYAELLVQQATGGELAPNSQRSWEVETAGGERLQVKARVVPNPETAGQRQLSVFRSWDFDAAVIVLFDFFGPHLVLSWEVLVGRIQSLYASSSNSKCQAPPSSLGQKHWGIPHFSSVM